jgi:hypothetical protein
MRTVRPFHNRISVVNTKRSFEIESLESNDLNRLFHETSSYVQEIRIEIVHHTGRDSRGEEHPATTFAHTFEKPTIQFIESLNRAQRIEVIAHELLHLLLVYRFGLGVVGRRVPRCGSSDDVFRYFMSMRGDWVFLLGQISNTAHHIILTDYLRDEYGIESHLHLRLLHHNLRLLSKENSGDKESLYARGIITFEYEKLIGKIDRVMNPLGQPELFRKACNSANEHFGSYRFPNMPTPFVHEDNVLSFLKDLGYEREDFEFFSLTDFCPDREFSTCRTLGCQGSGRRGWPCNHRLF